MIGSAGEIALARRALAQPSPQIHQGGDCGACALGGALGITVADVYSRFGSEGITHAGEMGRCLRCSVSEGLADRMTDHHAEWPSTRYWRSFGAPSFQEYISWFNHVRMAVDAGYYGLATVILKAAVNRKRLIHQFMLLPFHTQLGILKKLNLFTAEEMENKPDTDLFISSFARADEKGVLEALWEAIEAEGK